MSKSSRAAQAVVSATGSLASKYRVWNINLPAQKNVGISLTYLYGIGRSMALRICGEMGINPMTKVHHLEDNDFDRLREKIETSFEPRHAVMKRVGDNILAKVRMQSYEGIRHSMCLPVRGQKTKSNAITQRLLGHKRANMFNIPLVDKHRIRSGPPKRS